MLTYENLVLAFSPLVCYSSKMKWTTEEENLLINFRNEGRSYSYIAKQLNRSEVAVKQRGSLLIRAGRLKGKTQVAKRFFTSEELLEIVRNYHSHDALKRASSGNPDLPNPKTIQERFGSWAEARLLAKAGSSPGQMQKHWPTILYLVKFENYYKIGITQRTVRERFWGYPEYELIDQILYPDLESAYNNEQNILSKVNLYDAKDLSGKGKTECFTYEEDLSSISQLL